MLRNRRGATSLRWLRALLDHGIEVHGQVVVCPGVNDGAVLDDTLAGVLDRYPELASRRASCRSGVSRYNTEPAMRPHTPAEARGRGRHRRATGRTSTCDALGRRLVFAADEYYLLAGRPFPDADAYEGFPMHEDGIGMARTFELEFAGAGRRADRRRRAGFFAWVDGAPADGLPRAAQPGRRHRLRARHRPRRRCGSAPRRDAPVGVLTGEYGARVLAPLLDRARPRRRARARRSPTSSSAATSASPG